MESTIESASAGYARMEPKLNMVGDLWGGTATMQAAKQRWLPQEPGESDSHYTNRLNQSVFYNAYKRTVQNLVGKPFSKPMKVDEKILGSSLFEYTKDIDRTGRHIDVFGKDFLTSAIKDGLSHILVDFPAVGYQENLAAERDIEARPYFCQLDARQVFAWRYELINGKAVLTHVRIRECVTVQDGAYGEREVEQIRILEPGLFQIWQKQAAAAGKSIAEDKQWVMTGSGTTTLDVIPLVTLYTGRDGFMEAIPPLLDLGYLNVAHWQIGSDLRNILHIANVPILFRKGWGDTSPTGGTSQGTTIIASNMMHSCPNPQGDMKYVEHQGTAIGEARLEMQDLENRMAAMGLEPLVKKIEKSATEAGIDADLQYSDLGTWTRATEDALEYAFYLMGEWIGEQVPEERFVEIFKDFAINSRGDTDLATLQSLRQSGEITQKLLLEEFQRRGAIAPSVDIEAEIEAVRNEPPKLSSYQMNPDGPDPANPAYMTPTPEPTPMDIAKAKAKFAK